MHASTVGLVVAVDEALHEPRERGLHVGRQTLGAVERVAGLHRVVARLAERKQVGEPSVLPFEPDLIVCDVSFISVRLALPPALALARPGWEALVLVKPQFEAGRAEVGKGGVVRDEGVRRRVVREIAEAALAWGGQTAAAVDSGLPGPKGNREVFLHLVHREHPELPDDIDDRIAAAVI